ncbi:hypothetical protein EPR50_G00016270 [Perca flavescens]|uniref:Uncharacterized protein n=1 Tax=Perca flavescens TaxID=8167 RepID=A0A484DMW4_PERFV|nr:hypothetical protein EPR50_G00016270 [Perca flavescens]
MKLTFALVNATESVDQPPPTVTYCNGGFLVHEKRRSLFRQEEETVYIQPLPYRPRLEIAGTSLGDAKSRLSEEFCGKSMTRNLSG